MSLEIDTLFDGNFLIAQIMSFLETSLKGKLPFPKCSLINLQLSSFFKRLGFIYLTKLKAFRDIGKISIKNFTSFPMFPYGLIIFS